MRLEWLTSYRDFGKLISYNTRYSAQAKPAESFTFAVMGPDIQIGDWALMFFLSQQYPYSLEYDTSNGLVSRGDIFVSNVFSDLDTLRKQNGRIGFN